MHDEKISLHHIYESKKEATSLKGKVHFPNLLLFYLWADIMGRSKRIIFAKHDMSYL